MGLYIVTRERGTAWDASRPMREQDGWDAHARFMDALAAEGFIVLGGPLGDESRFLHVVRAEGKDALRARLEDDPWTPSGRLRLGSVERWQILLGDERRLTAET